MPPKRIPSASAVPPSTASPSRPSAASAPTHKPTTAIPASTTSKSSSSGGGSSSSSSIRNANPQSAQAIVEQIYKRYLNETPQRTMLLDAFMAFLVLVGVVQFVYCVIVGNYPFNAFLSGFSATVGQFVLTASLRMQSNPANKGEFSTISPERAFADYVLGSLLLHFFCVNFIN